MRRWILPLTAILIGVLLLSGKEDDSLKVKASISPKRLSRGQEGKVTLRLSLKKGIYISPHPSFVIEFDPSEELNFPKNFFTASDLEIETFEEDGEEYLNLEKPMEIPFSVKLEAKRGYHVLKGKVKYFASCPKEGWCLKSHATFSASFYTRRTVIRKKK
ncbi:MAG: hypothetical protein ACE5L7_06045 [Candidatus Aminicenantales bacterium]